MATTFTQLYAHIILAIKGRSNFIQDSWQKGVEKVITTTIEGDRSKVIALSCCEDHTHIVLQLSPLASMSQLVADVKVATASWINQANHIDGNFQWQDGYGAFSCQHSQLEDIKNYTQNQKEYHQKKSFKEEYLAILQKLEIRHENDSLFEWYS